MAALGDLHIEDIILQVNYGDGYRYLDRCGETLLDLRKADPNWSPGEVNPQSGALYHLTSGSQLTFNTDMVNLKRGELEVGSTELRQIFLSACKVVRRNVGFSEVLRFGFRTQNLVACASLDDAQERVARYALFSPTPKLEEAVGLKFKTSSHVAVYEEGPKGLRFAVAAVQRERGLMPTELMKKPHHLVPKNQREPLVKMLAEQAKCRKDPRFAVSFDLDFYSNDPTFDELEGFLAESDESRRRILQGVGVRL